MTITEYENGVDLSDSVPCQIASEPKLSPVISFMSKKVAGTQKKMCIVHCMTIRRLLVKSIC